MYPSATGHFSQTVSVVPPQGVSTTKPGAHLLHSLHMTSEVGVHGCISNSSSRQLEHGRHLPRREGFSLKVPSTHRTQRDFPFGGQKVENPGGHFIHERTGGVGERCVSVSPSDCKTE